MIARLWKRFNYWLLGLPMPKDKPELKWRR